MKNILTAALLSLLSLGNIAYAQTSTTTPGVPNTGMGGEIGFNLTLLLSSIAMIVGGITYLRHKLATR